MGKLLDDFKSFIESEDFLRFLDTVNFADKLNEKFDIVKYLGQGTLYQIYKL